MTWYLNGDFCLSIGLSCSDINMHGYCVLVCVPKRVFAGIGIPYWVVQRARSVVEVSKLNMCGWRDHIVHMDECIYHSRKRGAHSCISSTTLSLPFDSFNGKCLHASIYDIEKFRWNYSVFLCYRRLCRHFQVGGEGASINKISLSASSTTRWLWSHSDRQTVRTTMSRLYRYWHSFSLNPQLNSDTSSRNERHRHGKRQNNQQQPQQERNLEKRRIKINRWPQYITAICGFCVKRNATSALTVKKWHLCVPPKWIY